MDSSTITGHSLASSDTDGVVYAEETQPSGKCRYVLLGGAMVLLMACVVVALIRMETSLSSSWLICITAFVGEIIILVAGWRWWKLHDREIMQREQYGRSENYVIAVVLLVTVVVSLAAPSHPRCQSFAGFVMLLTLQFAFSTNRRAINWKVVAGSVLLQLLLVAILLRWRPAFNGIVYVTHVVSAHVEDLLLPGKINPEVKVILLVAAWGTAICLLFAIGAQRLPVRVTSYLLKWTLGASAIDSLLIVEGFLSSSLEIIWTMERYLAVMTTPELHILLTGIMAAWPTYLIPVCIALKTPVEYIIIFSISCAPATLVVAKLSHPDVMKSRSWTDLEVARVNKELHDRSVDGKKSMDVCKHESSNTNTCEDETLQHDLTALLKVAAAVPFVVVATIYLLGVVVMALSLVLNKNGSIDDILSFVFRPVAAILGVETGQADIVAKVIGTNLLTGNVKSYTGIRDALVFDALDVRGGVISFFACSASANLLRVIFVVAVIAFFCVTRRDLLLLQVGRAVIDANTAAFLTACVAGVLYSDTPLSFDATLERKSTLLEHAQMVT